MVRRLLAVGIDEYKTPTNNLNSCVADTQAVEALLRDEYSFTEIRRLHNGEATLEKVREQLDWLVSGVTQDDRVVYFQSSHGARIPINGTLEEVLVMHDEQFLHDDELSVRTRVLPVGVLTCLIDACHSGGLEKLVIFNDDGAMELVRAKVWEGPEVSMKAFGHPVIQRVKLFGAPSTGDAVGLRKAFALAKSGPEEGQAEMNGLLAAAAMAEETALAATSRTSGLSVFTFYLLEALRELGHERSTAELVTEADRRLKAVGYRQTPVVKAPTTAPDLADRVLFTMATGAKEPQPQPRPPAPLDPTAAAIRQALQALQGKGKDMSSTTPATPPATGAEDQQKFFGAILGAVVPLLAQHGPGIVRSIFQRDHRSKAFGEEPELSDEEMEKFLGPLLQVLIPIATQVIPVVANALRAQTTKDAGGAPTVADEDLEEKFFGPLLAAAAPLLINAIPHVVSIFQGGQPPQTSKSLVRDPEVDEKFLGPLLSGFVPALLQAVPGVLQALGGTLSSTKSFDAVQQPEPVLTSKGWFQPQPFPWQELRDSSRILQDGDELLVTVGDIEQGVAEIVLTQAPHKRWWKAISLEDSRGAQIDMIEVEGGTHVSRAIRVPAETLDFTRLVLWKAKLFGAHTVMYTTTDLKAMAGKQVTFNWLAD